MIDEVVTSILLSSTTCVQLYTAIIKYLLSKFYALESIDRKFLVVGLVNVHKTL